MLRTVDSLLILVLLRVVLVVKPEALEFVVVLTLTVVLFETVALMTDWFCLLPSDPIELLMLVLFVVFPLMLVYSFLCWLLAVIGITGIDGLESTMLLFEAPLLIEIWFTVVVWVDTDGVEADPDELDWVVP